MNIYEVAELAGVSATTVSRVINGSEHVSDEMRERVQKTIEELGFVPNFFARGLNRKGTKTVGILSAVISDLNHAKMVSLLEKYLRKNGFDIILCSLEQNYDDKAAYLDLLLQKHVDAIFVVGLSTGSSEDAAPLEAISKEIPLIVINGRLDIPNVYSVVCNEKYMAVSIVEQLCLCGCSRIAYLYDTCTYSGEQKMEGYRKGMEQCGLETEGLIFCIQEDISMSDIPESKRLIASYLRSLPEPPDAILTADDVLAAPALKALQELGMQMPVIGWNNSLFSEIATPTITSVDIDMDKISKTAVTLLVKVLEKKKVPKYIEVHARLVERESFSMDFKEDGNIILTDEDTEA